MVTRVSKETGYAVLTKSVDGVLVSKATGYAVLTRSGDATLVSKVVGYAVMGTLAGARAPVQTITIIN